jgi:hypothetical protein
MTGKENHRETWSPEGASAFASPKIWGEVFWDKDGSDRRRALIGTIQDLTPQFITQHVLAIGLKYELLLEGEEFEREMVEAKPLEVLNCYFQRYNIWSQNPERYIPMTRKGLSPPYLVVWSRKEDGVFGDPKFWNVHRRNRFVRIARFRLNFNSVLDALV